MAVGWQAEVFESCFGTGGSNPQFDDP